MMIWLIAKKELHANLLSLRFVIGLVASIGLTVLATTVGCLDFNWRLKSYAAKSQDYAEKIKNVRVYSDFQPVVLRPPEPFSIITRGFDAKLGTDVKISIERIPEQASGHLKGNEYLVNWAELDLTTIVKVVLGLLALLFTFDAFAGEKESGLLRFTLSHSISRFQVILGKYLGAIMSLVIPLLLSFGLGLLIIIFFAKVPVIWKEFIRIASIFMVYLLYLSAMALVGLCISTLTHRSSLALLFSVVVWFLFVSVLPNAATLTAKYGTPGNVSERAMVEQQHRLEAERDKLRPTPATPFPLLKNPRAYYGYFWIPQPNGGILYRFSHPKYNEAMAEFYRRYNAAVLDYAMRIYSRWEYYQAHLRSAARLADNLSRVSPAFLLQKTAELFCGTSIADYERFLIEVRRYRNQLIENFHAKNAFGSWRWFTDDPPDQQPYLLMLFPNLNLEEVDPETVWPMLLQVPREQKKRIYQAAEEDPRRKLNTDDLPQFTYHPIPLRERVQVAMLDLVLLIVTTLLLLVVTTGVFLNYDVK